MRTTTRPYPTVRTFSRPQCAACHASIVAIPGFRRCVFGWCARLTGLAVEDRDVIERRDADAVAVVSSRDDRVVSWRTPAVVADEPSAADDDAQ